MSAALPSILVPDGESPFALYVATCPGRFGHRVHALSTAPSARIRFSRHCVSFTPVPSRSPEERLERALEVVAKVGPCVVLPASEPGIAWALDHAEALRRAATLADLPDRESFAVASDKGRLAEFMTRHGIPCPETRLLPAGADPLAAARDLEFPVLWKPTRGSAGRGIRRFADQADLAALARVGTAEPGILQSEIPGQDWGVNVLCRGGEILAASVQHPLCTGARGFQPATAIAFVDDEAVSDVARRLVKALRWSGVVNLDLRRDARDGRVRVLETNPRYWSTLAGSCAAGVHFPHLACLAALGVPFAPPRARQQCHMQTSTAVKLLGRRSKDRPTLAETTLPGLLSDPFPFLAGKIEHEAMRLASAIRSRLRSALGSSGGARNLG